MTTSQQTISDWTHNLRATAGEITPPRDPARAFTAWAPMAPGFALWRARHAGAAAPAPPPNLGPDQRLWRALALPEEDPQSVLDEIQAPARERADADRMALIPQSMLDTIEVWTDCELSALQALAWHARRSGREELRETLHAVASFHVHSTQPDNATNRPWSINVFVERAVRHNDAEADMYAQTLLHNCAVSAASDQLSREILYDAAEYLEDTIRP